MPQYAMALSVDIKPGQVGKEANKLALNTGRNGEPGLLMKTVNLREYKMPQPSQGPGRYRDLNEPLGPETPPKMPAGTIKVDVSDTQDWYQLGQDISNLKLANKSHYNQGPPHTVIAFGSEDLEHMYIRQLKRLGLNTHDLDEPGEDDLDEGFKTAMATAALAGTMAMGAQAKAPDMVQQVVEPGDTVYSIARQNNVNPLEIYRLNKMDRNTKLEVGQRVQIPDYSKPSSRMPATVTPTIKPAPAAVTQQATGATAESALSKIAQAAGIKGTELAQFLAQCAHETGDFENLEELGGNKYLAQYDPTVNPSKAKRLGNTKAGDGAKYKGRGFIQITGKANYASAGQALGIDLVNNPEAAARPDIAAKIAVWYWKNRVAPYVQDFSDTRGVTKRINPGLQGLQDRQSNFKDYQQQVASVAKPKAAA